MEPVYAARAGGLGWIRVLILAEAVLFTVAAIAIAVYSGDAVAWLITTAGFALTIGLIVAILPRRYEVWPDRLSLVFPLWRWNIPFDTVGAVRKAVWWEAYAGMGMRFATSPGQAIVVERHQPHLTRPNLVISPEDREELILRLQSALTRYRSRDA